MTAPAAPPPAAPPGSRPTPPPLVRRRDDRVFRGVCAAVGRATGTDPLLWRVVLAVLALASGSGLVLYAAGWLLIPEQGRERPSGASRRSVPSRLVLLALAGTVALLLPGLWGGHLGALAPLAALGLLALLLLRDEPSRPAVAPAPGPAVPSWTGPAAAPDERAAYEAYRAELAALQPPWADPEVLPPPYGPSLPEPSAPVATARVRRPRSALGPLTVSAALLVTGVLLGLHALGVDGITAGRVLAAALAVVGGGLLVGARWGRSRGLLLLAGLLAAALAATASARVPVELSAGARTWHPTAGETSYALGLGQATLDLRDAPAGAHVQVRLAAGELRVLPPPGVRLLVRGDMRAGRAQVPGHPVQSGTDLGIDETVGTGETAVELDVRLGAGTLEVLP